MAELSADTLAILDRLKAEGALIRNGTNSVRSVNLKLDQFKPVFDAISANVIEQTALMKMQLGLATDALEAQKTSEQFKEIEPPESVTPDTKPGKTPRSEDETDAKINKIGDSIASALSLKNIAMAAGGAFVGYNALKGFIDEKYGGAFTDMETGIGALGPKLSEIGNIDIEAIKTQFEAMSTSISGIPGSLDTLNNNIQTIATNFDKIMNISWYDIAAGLILAYKGAGAALSIVRYTFNRMNRQLNDGMKPKGGKSWFQRMFGAPEVKAPTATPTQDGNPANRGRGNSPGAGSTVASRLEMRRAYAASPAGIRAGVEFKTTTNRVHAAPGPSGAAGKIMSDADILKAAEAALEPKYKRIYGLLTGVLKIAKPAMVAIELIRITNILSQPDSVMSQEQKMIALGPIVGEIVAGVGGALLGATIGAMGGPWGALIGGIGGGILGAFGGNKLGQYIVEWAFGQDPDAVARAEVDSVTGGKAALEAGQAAMNAANPPVPRRPIESGVVGDYARNDWDTNYGATHTADGKPKMLGGRGFINESNGERAEFEAYYEQILQQRNNSSNRALEADLLTMSAGGAGGNVIIGGATTIAPSPTYITNGGHQVSQVSFSGGGGMGAKTLLPYGITSGLIA
jgi:uncharacterized membrane protein